MHCGPFHTQDTTHKEGAPWGRGKVCNERVGGEVKGRGDGGYWHKKGREGEGAGAELAGRGTYTEVISTWPAPSPLSQPHRMAHTEKKQKEGNKYKRQK